MINLQNTFKGFLLGAAIIPTLGVAAHMTGYLGDESRSDYSLAHRFETAYSFNTPEDHKTYYTTSPSYHGEQTITREEAYMASPYVMWPLTTGLAFFLAGACFAEDMSEWKKRRMMKTKGSR